MPMDLLLCDLVHFISFNNTWFDRIPDKIGYIQDCTTVFTGLVRFGVMFFLILYICLSTKIRIPIYLWSDQKYIGIRITIYWNTNLCDLMDINEPNGRQLVPSLWLFHRIFVYGTTCKMAVLPRNVIFLGKTCLIVILELEPRIVNIFKQENISEFVLKDSFFFFF